jgi:hypothetical protein
MVLRTSGTSVVERKFAVEAPRQRVWNLLAKAIYQCVPLEKMNILNETNFHAELRLNLAFVILRFHLEGKFVDILSPSFLGCILLVNKGIIRLGLKVMFTLREISEDRSEVACVAIAEGKRTGGILGWILGIGQKIFAGRVFDSLEARLKQLC